MHSEDDRETCQVNKKSKRGGRAEEEDNWNLERGLKFFETREKISAGIKSV